MHLKLILVAGACVTLFPLFGQAYELDACAGTDYECTTVHIVNGSWATVTGFEVIETTRGTDVSPECTDGVWELTRNLPGLGGRYQARLNPKCRYVVKFKVTGGCSGDTTGQLSRNDMKRGYKRIRLSGGCGSLAVGKRRSRGNND